MHRRRQSQLVGGETSPERTTHILVKQPVKQVLASLSAYRQPPRDIGSRGQAPLNGIANGHVLVLHLLTHRDALPMMLCGSGAEICEVVVKNDRALINPERQN